MKQKILNKETILEKFKGIYGDDIEFDKKDYLVFKRGKKVEQRYIHVLNFEEEYEITRQHRHDGRMTIHHIDGCSWNPELWNLIAIKTKDHRRLHKTGKVVIGDWEGNIKRLMEELPLTEADLPLRVKEKFRNERVL